jgi:hypothetical protein
MPYLDLYTLDSLKNRVQNPTFSNLGNDLYTIVDSLRILAEKVQSIETKLSLIEQNDWNLVNLKTDVKTLKDEILSTSLSTQDMEMILQNQNLNQNHESQTTQPSNVVPIPAVITEVTWIDGREYRWSSYRQEYVPS